MYSGTPYQLFSYKPLHIIHVHIVAEDHCDLTTQQVVGYVPYPSGPVCIHITVMPGQPAAEQVQLPTHEYCNGRLSLLVHGIPTRLFL